MVEELREDEVTTLFGVSARTLIRFSEAGYLQPRKDASGMLFYKRSELCDLFTPGRREDEPEEEVIEIMTATASPTPAPESVQPSTLNVEKQAVTQPTSDVEERERLKHLVSLHERLLEQQEREIADLKEQRSWLQRRVEQLEQKAEKDQILLMTELQTVRQLVHQKRGLFDVVREWFTPPQLPASSQVDGDKQQRSGG